MHAMPSTTPLSRTAPCTSSVMSVTVSPPAVRKRVSCWKTFIAAAILREAVPGAGGEPSTLSGSCGSPDRGRPLVVVGREPLVEEAAEQEDSPDREERERPRDRAQRRQVVEEDLREADGEEREARDAQRAPAPLEADVQQREPEHAPEGADRGVAALELGLEAGARDPLEQLEDQERDAVDGESSGDPPGDRPEVAQLFAPCVRDAGGERHCGGDDEAR